MSKSISPISQHQSLKSNTTAIGIVSHLFNAILKVIRFILKHPIKAVTLGLAAQTLGSSTKALGEKPDIKTDLANMALPCTVDKTDNTSVMLRLINSVKNDDEAIYNQENDDDDDDDDDYESTPLHLAVRAAHLPAVKELVIKGFDIHAKDEEDMTPLDLACIGVQDNSAVVKFIKSKGANSDYCPSIKPQDEQPTKVNLSTQCLRR